MKAYEGIDLFKKQIERRTTLKVVLVPSPIKESEPTVRLALRKIIEERDTIRNRWTGQTVLRLTLALDGKLESATGLRLAAEAIESLLAFLKDAKRLEDASGVPVPSAVVTYTVNEDDGIVEDPDNGAVAWVRDEYFVTISIPQ